MILFMVVLRNLRFSATDSQRVRILIRAIEHIYTMLKMSNVLQRAVIFYQSGGGANRDFLKLRRGTLTFNF